MRRRATCYHSRVVAIASAAILLLAIVSGAAAQLATPIATPAATPSTAALPPAWLEFAPDGVLLARVIVDGACPAVHFDDIESAMTQRATASTDFPVVACEAVVPFGAAAATIRDQVLPLPDGPVERIAVIGDAGCRLSDWDKKYQACNDPQAWPFAQVARSVAAWQPDLIIHVGDFLYRESACPDGNVGCAGSPHGDNWPTWNADFFAPVSPLLGAAPWLFMRGNHETCDRNPEGWFAYLDPHPWQAACQQYTEPYVTTVRGLEIAVIDSAEAADTTVKPGEEEEYARQFQHLAGIAPPGSWLVTHRPFRGLLEGDRGEIEVQNAAYEAATGGTLDADYGLILSGHIHLAEALAFAGESGRPPQLIAGNSGTALDQPLTGTPTAAQLGDPELTEAETFSAFGYMTMEPAASGWLAIQRDVNGDPVVGCLFDLSALECIPAD
jgi:hypothetical protein